MLLKYKVCLVLLLFQDFKNLNNPKKSNTLRRVDKFCLSNIDWFVKLRHSKDALLKKNVFFLPLFSFFVTSITMTNMSWISLSIGNYKKKSCIPT